MTKKINLAIEKLKETNDPDVKEYWEHKKENNEEELKDASVLCDNGYVSNESIKYSVEEELNVFMPTSCDKKLYREELNEEKENVTADDCTYEKNGDEVSCTCPGGKTFTRIIDPKTKADKKIAFTAGVKSNCDGCPHFEKCRGTLSGTDKKFAVTLARIMIDKDLKAHIEKMKTDEAKQIYSKRMDIVEKVFGHIKENWWLDKLYRRGLQESKNNVAFNMYRVQFKEAPKGYGGITPGGNRSNDKEVMTEASAGYS